MFDTLQPHRECSSESLERLEQTVARFQAAWQGGQEPDISRFLEGAGEQRLVLLIELVCADMKARLEVGQPIDLQGYLGRHPELGLEPTVAACLQQREADLRRACAATALKQDGAATFIDPDRTAGCSAVPGSTATARTVCGPTTVAVPLPAVPGYELLGELGQGGMGVVYKARHLKLKRLVALKMILSGAHARPEALARFCKEAEAVARLQHPHVVQIYEIGEHDGRPFFSLEFVEGGSLDKKLAGTPQAPDDAAALLEKLAGAVHMAHAKGIIHRDLKPANVLLTADGQPKVSDFGLAKQLGDDSGQTQTGQVMGTPSYMAPEQAAGRVSDIGPATDVWALGAILYELLTGRPPFKGRNVRETLNQVFAQEPVPPRKLLPEIARDLETICLKCLQKDARRRYASAQELADDLQRYRNGEPIRARPVSEWARLWVWCKRNPTFASTSVVAAGALGVVITFVILFASNLSKFRQAVPEDERARAERVEAEAPAPDDSAINESDARLKRAEKQLQIQAAFDGHMRAGHELQTLKKLAAAIDQFQAALALKPDDAAALAALAAARKESGDQSRFAQLLEQGRASHAAGNYAAAVQAFEAALQLQPGDGAALAGLRQARDKAARTKIDQGLTAEFNKLMQTGNSALEAGNTVAAVQAYQAALKLRPGDGTAVAALGRARSATNDRFQKSFQDGNDSLQAGLAVGDQGGKGLVAMETALAHYTVAAQHLRAALKLKPGDTAVTAALKRALDHVDRQGRFMGHFKTGSDAYRSKNFDTAVNEIEQALTIFPDNKTAQNLLRLAKAGR